VTQLLPRPGSGADDPVPATGLDGEPITEADAEAYVSGICFKTGPPRRVGVELEWLVQYRADPTRRVPHELATTVAAAAIVRYGTLSVEPGGQVEYSSAPGDDLDACVAATRADLAQLRAAFTGAGLCLTGQGIDPYRSPKRVVDAPRYAAMEAFFDRDGPAGRWMMGCTASVQLCLDAGTESGPSGYARRWRVAHAIGPVLVAAFANSPLVRGRPSGWRSTRQAVWGRIDPGRAAPPNGAHSPLDTAHDPRHAWARYALDARVLCVRRGSGEPWTAEPGLTFRDWIRRGGSGRRRGDPGRPTRDDLAYHLTTLFPPVRPRGYLELRMVDAQPGDGWVVPLAVSTALLDDPTAGDGALAATEPLWAGAGRGRGAGTGGAGRGRGAGTTGGAGGGRGAGTTGGDGPWRRAARYGLADPALAAAARACFDHAVAGLARLGVSAEVRGAVADFADRYVHRGRSPADDVLAT
jgi:glutamate--cysteine ligase